MTMNRTGALVLLLFLAAPLSAATDLSISTGATSNVAFAGGVFEGSGGTANLNVADLVAALASGPVTIRTSSMGLANGDIIVNSAVTWSSSSSLRFEAYRNITLNASLVNTGGATVSLRADSSGTGIGTVIANAAANVSSGTAEVFYNPVTFGVPNVIWVGGTSPTAYMLVNTLTNLQNVNTNLSGSYALGRDLDASPTASWNAGAGFLPLGNAAMRFTGRFHGSNHVVRNLFINRSSDDYNGLFGFTQNATIQDVGISGANVTGHNGTGILAGRAAATTIARSFTSGNVQSSLNSAGGLTGEALLSSTISESWSTASVTSVNYAGGLVGSLNNTIILNSFATGTVASGGTYAGGLVAFTNFGTVVNSYAAGPVAGSAGAGGLVGAAANGTVFGNSYWDTQTSGQLVSAGGTGLTTAQMRQQANFSGWDFAGTWRIIGSATYPYLRARSAFVSSADLVISTAATSNVTISNNVFQATGAPAVVNVSDLATALASGNVIVRGLTSGSGDVAITAPVSWSGASHLRIEAQRDVLLASSISGGAGTLQLRANDGTITGAGTLASAAIELFDNPASFAAPADFSANVVSGVLRSFMLVHDRTDLESVATNLAGTYALAGDLDLGGIPFTPLGTTATPFTGTFSGDFRTIRGLVVNQPGLNDAGLFGVVSGATLRDVSIADAAVTGANNAGILAGAARNSNTVERVLTSGTVTASGSAAGGLLGLIEGGTVTRTSSRASVVSTGAGQSSIGGLIGLANAFNPRSLVVTDSYATGMVSGGASSNVGGLIGFNNNTSTITRSFSSGSVSSTGSNVGGFVGANNAAPMSNNYWDMPSSGLSFAGSFATATGLTTAQMRSRANFSGWDFTGVWNNFDNLTAPFLRIENVAIAAAPSAVIAGTQLAYTFAAAASTQTYENVVPVSFTHSIPAGTTLVTNTLPAPMNVAPGWSGAFGVTVLVAPSLTASPLAISGTFDTPTFSGPLNAGVTVTTSANVAIVVVPTPDPVIAGGTLTYTATITNAGPSDAANLTVTPVLPAGVTLVACAPSCSLSALAAGSNVAVTITGFVAPATATGTTLTATISVSSTTTDPDLANNTTSPSVLTTASADLAVAASVSAAEAGSPITWSVTVTNNGPSDAANIALAHVLPPEVTPGSCSGSCTASTLAAGGSAMFTISGTVAPSTPAGTMLTGNVSVTASTPDPDSANNGASASVVTTATADLAVTNLVSTTGSAGAPATWTITVTNNGPSDVSSVVVSHTSPAEVTGISCSSSCTAVSIAAGATVTFTINGTIDPGTVDATVVSLTAAVAHASDPFSANDAATAAFTVGTSADLSVMHGVSPASAVAGTGFPFTIQVTNAGPSVASAPALSLSAPTGVTFSSITAPSGWTCTAAITCTAATLAAGQSLTIGFTAAIDPSVTSSITLTSTLSAATADPDLPDNVAASTIAVTELAAITVAITDTPDPVAPNGTITYAVDVTNAGPSFGTNIPFGVTLPPELTLVSMTPPAGTIASLPIGTQSYTVVADVSSSPGATITTTATAGTASASTTTAVSSPSAVSVVKSVAGVAFFVSQPATYSITITNNGTSTQFDNAGDEMIDTLPDALTLTGATATAGTVTTAGNAVSWNGAIAPGASVTLTITATVNAPGPITNQAAIHFDADGNGTNESHASSNAVTITARAAAAIPTASTWVLLAMIAALALAGWMKS